MATLIGPIVAGIPLHQELPDGARVTTAGGEEWAAPALVVPGAAPIILRHRIGEIDETPGRLLVTAPPPMGRCWVDAAGHLALSNAPPGETGTVQLLRTIRDGHEYELTHASARAIDYYQWLWQRAVVSYALPSRGIGLMAHACGVALPGDGALLCPGVAGTGKSTLGALLAREAGSAAQVLSDDRVAMTVDDAGVRAWGTPWHSSAGLATPTSGRVRAIVFVRHGSGAAVRQLAFRDVMSRMLRTMALPFWSEPLLATALAFLERLVASAPTLEFSYSPAHPAAAAMLLREVERLTSQGAPS